LDDGSPQLRQLPFVFLAISVAGLDSASQKVDLGRIVRHPLVPARDLLSRRRQRRVCRVQPESMKN